MQCAFEFDKSIVLSFIVLEITKYQQGNNNETKNRINNMSRFSSLQLQGDTLLCWRYNYYTSCCNNKSGQARGYEGWPDIRLGR